MSRFNYALSIVTLLILAAIPTVAQSIVVSNDEWIWSQYDLHVYDDAQFADNVAAWLTSRTTGNHILILSSNYGLNNSSLISQLAGYSVVRMTSVPAVFPSAATVQAIYVSGDCTYYPLVFATSVPCTAGFAALDAALVTYVNGGGNVFLEGGLTCHDDRQWNAFLNAFGLSMDDSCNLILKSKVNVSAFQTQPPYGPGLFTNVNNLYIDNGENLQNQGTDCGAQVFNDTSGNGLYAAWQPCCNSGPNLVENGSFETGDFTDWTTGGNFEFSEVVSGAFYAYSGAESGGYYAVLGPVGADGTLSQSFVTTPGVDYTFCFWLAAVGDNPSDFTAYWDNQPVYSKNEPNTGAVWTLYSFHVTGTGSDTITFSFRDDPAYIALDNVSVRQ
jgi:hypothetical protein